MHTPNQRWLAIVKTMICVTVLLFVFAIPPFQAPDEDQHFFKAYQLSTGQVRCVTRSGISGALLPRSVGLLAAVDLPREQTGIRRTYSLAELGRAWNRHLDPADQVFVPIPNLASYPPSLYAAQAAGIVVGRALRLPPLGLFYAARLGNAVLGVSLIVLAMTLMPVGRSVMAAAAALPTTLAQTSSVSADAIILGIGFLATALALRMTLRRSLGPADWSIVPVDILLALAKGVYGPLALVGVAGYGAARMRPPKLVLVAASCVVAYAAVAGWMVYSAGTQLPFSIMLRTTGEHAMTANIGDQARYVLSHPLRFAWILPTSFANRFPVYVLQIFGRFGWSVILMPLANYLLGAMLLVLGTTPPGDAERPTAVQRAWWFVLVFGGTVLIETALYLTGTPLAANFIQGTQGRYFLPFLPVLGLVFLRLVEPRGRGAALWRVAFPATAVCLALGAVATVIDSFWVSGVMAYNGLPPITPTLSGLLRVCFLPSGRW